MAHERPDRRNREARGVIELTDMPVATSGNDRHWVEVDGKVLSHTMDPSARGPTDNGIASVPVLTAACLAADAWATAFMALGAEAAGKLAAEVRMGAVFVLEDGTVRSTI